MLSLSTDELFLLSIELDYPDLLKLCRSHPKINNILCGNENFWKKKVLQEFGPSINKPSTISWKKYYKLLLIPNIYIPIIYYKKKVIALGIFKTLEEAKEEIRQHLDILYSSVDWSPANNLNLDNSVDPSLTLEFTNDFIDFLRNYIGIDTKIIKTSFSSSIPKNIYLLTDRTNKVNMLTALKENKLYNDYRSEDLMEELAGKLEKQLIDRENLRNEFENIILF